MNINQIRRRWLTLWLQTVRLPLTLTEAVVRPSNAHGTWPPAAAFDTFEAAVKEMVGRVTSDDALVEAASLQRAELTQRRRAVALRSDSESIAAEARRDADDEKALLERRREKSAQRSRDAKRRAAVDRENAQRLVEEQTEKKRAASATAAATRATAVSKAATKANADRLRKDAQALRATKRAVAAQSKTLDLDKAVRAKRTARRAS
jgi:hypothetical protein